MNSRRLIVLLACALLFTACASTQKAAATSDAAEVEAFFRSGIEAFNRHDLDTFLRQFAPEIEMYTPTGWLRGSSAVRERFATTFKQFPDVRMELEDLKVRSVAADTVVTTFRWRVYPMGRGPAFHGVGSGVYVRNERGWTEVLEHETVTRTDEGLQQPPAK